MPRQGKQLNIWIPDEVMDALEHWINENQTTKTDGVIQAIQVLTGTHPEAPPDLRSQVQALTTVVEQLQQRLDRLESQTMRDLEQRLEQLEPHPSGLHPEASAILQDLGIPLEQASREQLQEICTRLGISSSKRSLLRWSQEKLRQAIQEWRPQ